MGIDSNYSPDMLEHVLPMYYKKAFPFNLFVRWLAYGRATKAYFAYREFTFTLKDDVYVRFQSFNDQAEFEKEVQRIQPHKMDIGAVYTHRPREHKTVNSVAFQAVERELIFDIDMTDYDEVRSCCSGADICARCWPLMRMAVRILDRALREDFGFEHLLWVYSGRRGVHCWVADEEARKLSSPARTAVCEYLSLVKGNESQRRKVNLSRSQVLNHPFVSSSLSIIREYFPRYACEQQGFMGTGQRVRQVLGILPNPLEKVREALEQRWAAEEEKEAQEEEEEEDGVSTLRWNTLSKHLASEGPVGESTLAEIMTQFCYPRLDVNVTIGINHLLKSPFCVHPKTGRVCVPFDPERVDNFDPAAVPTVTQVLEELAASRSSGPEEGHVLSFKRTSLRDAMRVFGDFVTRLEAKAGRARRAEGDAELTF